MIRGILTDIDGVLIGEKEGYNFPNPHPDVTAKLRAIQASGIPITLCTAKPNYSIQTIIAGAKLSCPHITDAGSVIIDPITNKIITKHTIDSNLATQIVDAFLTAGVYTEIYTPTEYMIEKRFRSPLTDIHTQILQHGPALVPSLQKASAIEEVTKIMPIAENGADKERLIQIFAPFAESLNLAWGLHPIANPHVFGIITAKGVSKRTAAIEVSSFLHIPLSEYLGIGDSTSDWKFMELCGATATVSNGSDELKKLVNFVAPTSVDENGILSIFNHYRL